MRDGSDANPISSEESETIVKGFQGNTPLHKIKVDYKECIANSRHLGTLAAPLCADMSSWSAQQTN